MKMFEIFGSKNKTHAPALTPAEYYEKLGGRARFAAIVCALIFAVVVMFSASAYSQELTMDNLRYMLKFIDQKATAVEPDDTIEFDYDENNIAVMISGAVAICNPLQIAIYDIDGEELQKDSFRTENPLLASNDKYIYLCNSGGNELRVYTAYRTYYTETFAYPLTALAASENGGFAIATSVKGYRSAVMVYNSYFKTVYTCKYGDKYVSGIDVSDSGNQLSTVLQYSDGGDLIAELMVYDISQEGAIADYKYSDELPLKVHYFSNGCIALLTDKYLRTYDSKGKLISETDVSSGVTGCCLGDTAIALYSRTVKLGGGCVATVYGTNGELLMSENLGAEPADALILGGKMYILQYGDLLIYDFAGQSEFESIEVDTAYHSIITDESMLLLVGGDTAVVFRTLK